ncbi:MAG: histidinol-phosphatase [Verrucomicrobia bacterium CG_4_10_14_3_um_filter_43_23]|nr:MAG: histidinol-phosphatase [Verrucomicrobia bacterium CG22_combo_CG10-13_8_21_14_all_43_17]PIX58551.1 MAG: histidinol-phosphatase [Verrucomicrobia bacterium CG_4_10_14_3_um_filter_43_23]PIY62341.1 MAG: histidinol-phosphatase [Verrucomicrobia bacterium CG_4_10_14_0_8_um_filter_43_34]PJA44059.1 MAG: histidinol-phosphatase [Verrucomicrobia bacterium CG_4_9_14_3_um_filter_43_20]
MNKREIAQILDEIAVLLELKGENPFKIRAYQNAARALETFQGNFEETIKKGHLEDIPGVGKAIEEKILTLHKTGKLAYYQELAASIPEGLIKMLDIPGLGGKRIKLIHDNLGIETIEDLKLACQAGKIAQLPGMGAKSQNNILAGIEHLVAYSQRHLWWEAYHIAEPILNELKHLPETVHADLAGSLRRRLETIGDLDFVVGSKDPQAIMDWFTKHHSVESVTAKGETKSSVRLKGGIQADLRVVAPEQYYFALHHFTGSKDHNIQMRQRALHMGYSLSEWGLKAEKDDHKDINHVKGEAELFKALKLSYIPPELREGLDELDLAAKDKIPHLVQESDIRGVFHNHTVASDGVHTLEQMAETADSYEWEYLGIADHSKSSRQANGLDEERLLAQIAEIRTLNKSKRFNTHIFAGTECDILPDGSLDFEDAILKELDYVVVSIHSNFNMDEDAMTKRIIKAIEHPYTSILAHPTGRLLLRREPYAVDMMKVIDAAIANKVIIELNANPYRLDMDWRLWRNVAERNILCSINPDAHSREQLMFYKAGINIARKGMLTKEHILNTRPLTEVTRYFKKFIA